MRATVFVATYEMPKHLALVCAGLARQSERDFEVLFCDDGSGPETARVIEDFGRSSGVSFRHFRQEHDGFRKCRILNQALRQARADTFIFLDGDCVPHRHFVKDHLSQQEEGRYLAGRRMEIGQKLASQITPEMVSGGFFDFPHLETIKSVCAGDSEFLNRSIRFESPFFRKLFKMDRVVDLKGCNYSLARKSLEAINGFDEEYEGYGREDTDVEIRLQNLGMKIKSLKGLALQFHIWHPRRDFTPANDNRLEELKRSGRVRCKQGWITE